MKKIKYQLLFARGPLKGLRYDVREGEFHLGRSRTCAICIPDPRLSRKHCLFVVSKDGLSIVDLASVNGTFANGKPIDATIRPLKVGDRITVGDTSLIVVVARHGRRDAWRWAAALGVVALVGGVLALCIRESWKTADAVAGRGAVRESVQPEKPEVREIAGPAVAQAEAVTRATPRPAPRPKPRPAPAPSAESPAPKAVVAPAATADASPKTNVSVVAAAISPVASVRPKAAEQPKVFKPDTQVVISNRADPIRGVLVSANAVRVTLEIRPGVEYAIPRDWIRKINTIN